VFDSGSVPFVKDTCHWDPYLDLWRRISCIDHHNISVEWFSDDGCSQLWNVLDVQNDTCYYIDGTPISEEPTANPTISLVETDPPTSEPTMTDSPTLSPIVISNELCDYDHLLLQLNDTFYEIGDFQWIDDCLKLLSTRTHQVSIVCGCIGKFWRSMANQYLNCVLEDPWHGLSVWNMCHSSIYKQSCGSKCTTIIPVEIDPPTPEPTMTDSPTLSPIVVSNELCDYDHLLLQLNDTFYEIGDIQWIDDCLELLSTRTHQLSIVCGCIGKFPKSMANQHLNCVLEEPYHGLTVWNMCYSSFYKQSCGSQCTGWLRRRQPQQEISLNRRRAVADSTFKLIWSEAVCQI